MRQSIFKDAVNVVFRQYDGGWTAAILFREAFGQGRGALVVWVGLTHGELQAFVDNERQTLLVKPGSEFNVCARVLRPWGSRTTGALRKSAPSKMPSWTRASIRSTRWKSHSPSGSMDLLFMLIRFAPALRRIYEHLHTVFRTAC